jgi:nucleoside-diphosphate-sugar epimerase
LQELSGPENLNTSSLTLYELFFKPIFSEKDLYYAPGWVDVRDVAKAHIVSLEKEEVAGERILITSRAVPQQEFLEAAKRAAASLGITGIQTGIKDYDPKKATLFVLYNPKKRERLLGFELVPLDEMVRDTLANLKERGWIPQAA